MTDYRYIPIPQEREVYLPVLVISENRAKRLMKRKGALTYIPILPVEPVQDFHHKTPTVEVRV